ncbi:hypothetical protein TNCV_3387801 [Trichonephila clavipes]|nr:hypothetical protein TNCV_3387801 [Trichonephila clavipes]
MSGDKCFSGIYRRVDEAHCDRMMIDIDLNRSVSDRALIIGNGSDPVRMIRGEILRFDVKESLAQDRMLELSYLVL